MGKSYVLLISWPVQQDACKGRQYKNVLLNFSAFHKQSLASRATGKRCFCWLRSGCFTESQAWHQHTQRQTLHINWVELSMIFDLHRVSLGCVIWFAISYDFIETRCLDKSPRTKVSSAAGRELDLCRALLLPVPELQSVPIGVATEVWRPVDSISSWGWYGQHRPKGVSHLRRVVPEGKSYCNAWRGRRFLVTSDIIMSKKVQQEETIRSCVACQVFLFGEPVLHKPLGMIQMIPQAASMFLFGNPVWTCFTFACSVGYSFAIVKTASYLQLSWFFHGMYAMTCRYYTAFDAKSFRVGCLCMFFKVYRQNAKVFSNADWFGIQTSHARFCASKAWAQWSRENLRKVLKRSFNTPWHRSNSLSNLGD